MTLNAGAGNERVSKRLAGCQTIGSVVLLNNAVQPHLLHPCVIGHIKATHYRSMPERTLYDRPAWNFWLYVFVGAPNRQQLLCTFWLLKAQCTCVERTEPAMY